MKRFLHLVVLSTMMGFFPTQSSAQFRALETEHLRLVYFDLMSDYLVGQLGRSFNNSLGVYQEMFSYEPSERVTVFLHDMGDYGNAGADVLPRNRIMMAMAPLSYVFETAPANERMNSTMHHELVHVVTNDHAAGTENFFRGLFQGKVAAEETDPITILYSYLTAPRRYSPRWYQEGIAVFMETWMSGGLGRTLGGYDEMVFRTRVLEDSKFYDMVGLESEGTSADFQVGVNSYLYGTRFMSYLAVQYGAEHVLEWMDRAPGSKSHFTAQFRHVFGTPIATAWQDWIAFEKDFQRANLESIRRVPMTEYREIATRPLGSMSRAFVDPETGALLAAVNYPGKLSHIASIDLLTGDEKKLTDVTGPTLFYVSSLAFDPVERRIFYTTNNNRRRDLMVLDVASGESSMLIKGGRIGDLAFNRSERSVWGVRHDLGFSTIVRIPPPYDKWEQVYSLTYGRDLYDIDVSPDGQWLTGALAEIDGSQSLVRFEINSLLKSEFKPETLYSFDLSNPEGFVFSPDGRYLYGSSYYTGASNIFRYDFDQSQMQALTNTDTGFFRPIPTGGDSLMVARFTAEGFQPVMIADRPRSQIGTISLLGNEVVEKNPVVMSWKAPPPSSIDLDSLGFRDEPYSSFGSIESESIYPIVHGYKDEIAVGLRLNLSDPLSWHRITASVAILPNTDLPDKERFHASLDYRFISLGGGQWSLSGSYNRSDFYDLFGPTKQSRRGYAISATHNRTISYEGPKKNLSYEIGVAGYFDLERLPSFQEIAADFSELGTAHASLGYRNLRSSLGAVDNESGYTWSLSASTNYVNSTLYPRFSADFDFGFLLPVSHLSLWVRSSAGISAGDVGNVFAKYYFGGFRNNWVDKREEKQYHNPLAFPGVDIDEISGTNYARVQTELILPPVRFRHVGGNMMYLKWLRLSLFTTSLITNIDRPGVRQDVSDFGAQIDLRIMLFSYLRSTLSFGHAVARGIDGASRNGESMISLKIM